MAGGGDRNRAFGKVRAWSLLRGRGAGDDVGIFTRDVVEVWDVKAGVKRS